MPDAKERGHAGQRQLIQSKKAISQEEVGSQGKKNGGQVDRRKCYRTRKSAPLAFATAGAFVLVLFLFFVVTTFLTFFLFVLILRLLVVIPL